MRGDTLTLEWTFIDIPMGHLITNAILHFNVTSPITTELICNWDSGSQTPSVAKRGRELFGARISVSFNSNIYKLTLTNFEYNDTGPYFLQAAVGPGGLTGNVIKSSIIIAKILGKYEILISCFFFVRI